MSVLTFVTIGDEGNAVDTTGYGDVSYAYDISKFEITEGNIAEYNADPANSTRLITIDSRGTDKPATDITWNECARYVNWLNINDGAQPAYNFALPGINEYIDLWTSGEAWQLDGENLFRHKDAKYFIPNENEWYKAAYYKSGGTNAGYWLYPTGSDTAPTAVTSGTVDDTAVYVGAGVTPLSPADVTEAGGLSPYGTMGQGGNVYEHTENTFDGANVNVFANRVYRGGSSGTLSNTLINTSRAFAGAQTGSPSVGLRVAKVSAPAPPRPLVPNQFVTIANTSNVDDTTGYGAVSYEYQISKFEAPESEIDAYNADPINANTLITKDSRGANKPATDVTWNECARYVNWLNIKESRLPAYLFLDDDITSNITPWDSADAWQLGGENLFRHRDAKYFLPSEDEWYKAAYYGGGVYYTYPTGSNSAPATTTEGTLPDTAVYIDGVNPNPPGPADVDLAGGLSPYGTMAQGGNTYEWNESTSDGLNNDTNGARVIRGGAWYSSSLDLQSSFRSTIHPPDYEIAGVGFRVVAIQPPSAPNTSPVLNLADNLKVGALQVTAAYLDSTRVWPNDLALWSFESPGGSTITGFKITTSSGDVIINWGDGTEDTVNSGQVINKTY